MSEVRSQYTSSGRRMPPPPRTTPSRSSSVCRTPTRRFRSSECKSAATRGSRCREDRRAARRDGSAEAARDFPSRLPADESRSANSSRLPADESRGANSSRLPADESRGANSSRLPADGKRTGGRGPLFAASARTSRSDALEESGGGQMFGDRDHSALGECARGRAPPPRPTRSVSPRESDFRPRPSVGERVWRSLSARRRRAPQPSVVGTEILAPMPRLQGTGCASGGRDRKTVERFIAHQPRESQAELHEMLREYDGREEALCGALAEAYGESWDAAVRGAADGQKAANGSAAFPAEDSQFPLRVSKSYCTSLRSTPPRMRPHGGRRESCSRAPSERDAATTMRSGSEPCIEDTSPKPRERFGNGVQREGSGSGFAFPSRTSGMLTPPVPQDLIVQ